jgi:hypothetical protein
VAAQLDSTFAAIENSFCLKEFVRFAAKPMAVDNVQFVGYFHGIISRCELLKIFFSF